MLFSLAYGVHALGPGHGKVVISTFLATHPAQLKTSMKLTLLAALLQGAVAIALVTLMLVVLQTRRASCISPVTGWRKVAICW